MFSSLIDIEKTSKSNAKVIILVLLTSKEIKKMTDVNPRKKTEEVSAEEYCEKNIEVGKREKTKAESRDAYSFLEIRYVIRKTITEVNPEIKMLYATTFA